MNRLAVALLAVVALAGCHPVPQTVTPRPEYGVLIADPNNLEADYAAGIRTAIRSEHWNDWSPAKATAERAVLDRYRAAGFRVGVNMGLHSPPPAILAEPDGALVDQHGVRSKQANLVWSASVRDRAAAYMADVIARLGPLDIVTIGVGSTGEADYPHPAGDGWWAYGPSARSASPFPDWVPGQPAPVGQAAVWWAWYRDALVSTVRWEVNVLRSAGYTGPVQVQIPGAGAKPAVFAARLAAGLADVPSIDPGRSVNAGAVFDQTIPAIAADLPGVIIDTTSLGNQSGTPVGNTCEPDDLERAPTDPTIGAWSSARWITYIARRAGLPVYGENTGWNEAVDLPMIAAQMDGCGIPFLAWAFDYQLRDGTSATAADLAGMIAR